MPGRGSAFRLREQIVYATEETKERGVRCVFRVGVDIGYGFVKAVSSEGKRVVFPSLAAPTSVDPLAGIFQDGIGHHVKVSSPTWGVTERLVGEAALRSLAAQGFVAQQEKPAGLHDLLLFTATYLVGAGEGTELAVGLPLAFYRTQREALRERLRLLKAWVGVDGGEHRYITFQEVQVYPQGAGALLTLAGSLPRSGLVGLVDVGTYTTDYLLFELREGFPLPVAEACGSVEAGVHLVHRALAAEFERQTGAPLPVRMHQQVLEKARAGERIPFRGKDVDLTPAFVKARREAAETIAAHVLAAWGDRTNFFSLTAFAGGGALLFGEWLEKHFPRAVRVPDPVFANALGYLMMLAGRS